MDNSNNFDRAYTQDYYNQYRSTVQNGTARIPICFCVDVSKSMGFVSNPESDLIIEDSPSFMEDGMQARNVRAKNGVTLHYFIEDAVRSIDQMLQSIKENSFLSDAAVVSIITFSQFSDCIVEFSDVWSINWEQLRDIRVNERLRDETNAAKGLNMALTRLDQYSRMLESRGNESYKPVLIFISDGFPTDTAEANDVGREIRKRSDNGSLNVVPIGIGTAIDEAWMRSLSRSEEIYRTRYKEDYNRIFEIITTRAARASVSLAADENNTARKEENEQTRITGDSYTKEVSDDELFMQFFYDIKQTGYSTT